MRLQFYFFQALGLSLGFVYLVANILLICSAIVTGMFFACMFIELSAGHSEILCIFAYMASHVVALDAWDRTKDWIGVL